jgi:hypothetical protein
VVTLLQIAQMLVASLIHLAIVGWRLGGRACWWDPPMLGCTLAAYLVYLALFAQIFVGRYLGGGRAASGGGGLRKGQGRRRGGERSARLRCAGALTGEQQAWRVDAAGGRVLLHWSGGLVTGVATLNATRDFGPLKKLIVPRATITLEQFSAPEANIRALVQQALAA